MVLPHINMNPPWATRVLHPEPPSYLPPCTLPPGHPSAPALSILYWTWTGYSFLIWYYTCFHAIHPNHPTLSLSHRVQKTVLYISFGSLLLSCIQSYRYHLSKFHIYALVYCVGVFLSGLLNSVFDNLLISRSSKVMLKILQVRLQQYINRISKCLNWI